MRGPHSKVDKLTTHWLNHFPHILCITEHHLTDFEIGNICIKRYNLGAFYCRKSRKHCGVSIFVHDTLTYINIDLNKYCSESDLEACALKLKISTIVFIFYVFIDLQQVTFQISCLLESTLTQLYSNTTSLIICGDININYLKTSNYKTQLDYLLASYNLSTAVDFPTRITKNISTATKNIFIDKTKNSDYTI
jgi:exonuclease III